MCSSENGEGDREEVAPNQREMAGGGGGVAESVLGRGNRETFILWMESQDLVTDWTWR